jgi:hypothetical protein
MTGPAQSLPVGLFLPLPCLARRHGPGRQPELAQEVGIPLAQPTIALDGTAAYMALR